jgi:hypothetical protein
MSAIICAGSFQWESELQSRSGGRTWCGSDFKIDAKIWCEWYVEPYYRRQNKNPYWF